ncbi:MAG TPA: glycosyltransferase [Bryobacteraceae bacterium]|nr:glycosyltransferase [Bryobacteraceae bacterium]
MNPPRVAFFTDGFYQVSGVGLTSREFAAFAERRELPFLSVHAGPADRSFRNGPVFTVEFRRRWPRWNLEHDLSIDLFYFRHLKRLRAELAAFQPDLIHITGPGDAGILGAMLAYEFKIPLVASWHTNLHEFAARRLAKALRWMPTAVRSGVARRAERHALDLAIRFYQLAKLIFAPNPELVELLAARTGRPAFLMTRGIDTDLFSPARRARASSEFTLGYVGRLSPEKNVRLLAEIERRLVQQGIRDYRFLIVGEGQERPWLRRAMQRAELPGVLRGVDLARAYASMDVFLFPSATDTFGNVILEACASGVPSIVTPQGGPKFLIAHGVNGYVARDAAEFAAGALDLMRHPAVLAHMRQKARQSAEAFSWNAVFDGVYASYKICFPRPTSAGAGPPEDLASFFLAAPAVNV